MVTVDIPCGQLDGNLVMSPRTMLGMSPKRLRAELERGHLSSKYRVVIESPRAPVRKFNEATNEMGSEVVDLDDAAELQKELQCRGALMLKNQEKIKSLEESIKQARQQISSLKEKVSLHAKSAGNKPTGNQLRESNSNSIANQQTPAKTESKVVSETKAEVKAEVRPASTPVSNKGTTKARKQTVSQPKPAPPVIEIPKMPEIAAGAPFEFHGAVTIDCTTNFDPDAALSATLSPPQEKPAISSYKPSQKSESKSKTPQMAGKSRYWTPEEHQRFLEGIEKYGPKDIKAISAHVKTRNATQVRTHAQKYQLRLQRESERIKENSASGVFSPTTRVIGSISNLGISSPSKRPRNARTLDFDCLTHSEDEESKSQLDILLSSGSSVQDLDPLCVNDQEIEAFSTPSVTFPLSSTPTKRNKALGPGVGASTPKKTTIDLRTLTPKGWTQQEYDTLIRGYNATFEDLDVTRRIEICHREYLPEKTLEQVEECFKEYMQKQQRNVMIGSAGNRGGNVIPESPSKKGRGNNQQVYPRGSLVAGHLPPPSSSPPSSMLIPLSLSNILPTDNDRPLSPLGEPGTETQDLELLFDDFSGCFDCVGSGQCSNCHSANVSELSPGGGDLGLHFVQ